MTGATGFIGGRLVRRLVADHEVRALVRTPAKAAHLEELGVELHPGDLTDAASLAAGIEGCDAVVHGAAFYELGPIDRAFMTQVNVDGTRAVMEAALEAGVGPVVYISSIAALGDTGGAPATEDHEHGPDFPSHYERTKYEAHQIAREYREKGLGVRQVMPGVVYGPDDPSAIMGYFRDFVRRRLPARVGEDTVQSFVHVEDVADGIVRVLTDGEDGEEYLLAGFPHSFREVNALLELLTGVRPPRLRMPLALARLYARLSEGFGHLLGRKVLVTREGVETMADLCYMFDSAKAIDELGWQPRTLPVGLAETVESLGVILKSDPRPKVELPKDEAGAPQGADPASEDAAAAGEAEPVPAPAEGTEASPEAQA